MEAVAVAMLVVVAETAVAATLAQVELAAVVTSVEVVAEPEMQFTQAAALRRGCVGRREVASLRVDIRSMPLGQVAPQAPSHQDRVAAP